MRAKFIYLIAVLVAYLLTSCRTSKTVERVEAQRITTGKIATNVVSLDSLQRWLTGRLLVTEVHLHQPDSTWAQAVEKVITKELTFAGCEEQAQEVKAESQIEVKDNYVMNIKSTENKGSDKLYQFLAAASIVFFLLMLKKMD